jgi:DNA-binding NtrC family response regulator
MSRPVLLVDDDPHMLDLMVLELDAEGIEHRSASSGAEARAALAEETPSTIVLDLLLPDVQGTELLKHIRKDHPATPVVVVTAQDDVERAV